MAAGPTQVLGLRGRPAFRRGLHRIRPESTITCNTARLDAVVAGLACDKTRVPEMGVGVAISVPLAVLGSLFAIFRREWRTNSRFAVFGVAVPPPRRTRPRAGCPRPAGRVPHRDRTAPGFAQLVVLARAPARHRQAADRHLEGRAVEKGGCARAAMAAEAASVRAGRRQHRGHRGETARLDAALHAHARGHRIDPGDHPPPGSCRTGGGVFPGGSWADALELDVPSLLLLGDRDGRRAVPLVLVFAGGHLLPHLDRHA